jgi:PRTRC genetic system protein B
MSLHISSEISSGLRLEISKAILLYRGGSHSIATIHGVTMVAGKPVIGPGTSATVNSLADLVMSMMDSSGSKSGFLDGRILAHNHSRLIWWCPSAVRSIWFNTPNKEINQLNGKDVRHPGIIFMASNSKLSAFAIRSDKRPDLQTELYRAPYFNQYEDGSFCMGNANWPKMPSPAQISKYEDAFFNSAFSHNHINLKLTRGIVYAEFWKQSTRNGARSSRHNLIRLGLTLEGLMRRS